MNKKICLFTAHSPLSGGGSVILQSIISNIPNLTVEWYYTASKPAKGYETGYCGNTVMGGTLFHDITTTWKLLNLQPSIVLELLVNQLLEIDCDAYWIVSHNEGLRVAWELTQRQSKRPVHLTVHDDWSGALCARSVRYRFMAPKALRLTKLVLKSVRSYDVVSSGMQDYYQKLVNKKGEICHRYLPAQSIKVRKPFISSLESIQVGHIGSIYSKKYFLLFLSLLHKFSQLTGAQVILHMWGCHLRANDIPHTFRNSVQLHNSLPEDEVIPLLAECHFVYSMYPMDASLRIFSETSLPTKLTSYLQACRPIFGHSLSNSTLANFIDDTKTGVVWSTGSAKEGLRLLESILVLNPDVEIWQKAGANYFGKKNLAVMQQILS